MLKFNKMLKKLTTLGLLAVFLFTLTACPKVPVTKRRQAKLMNELELIAMAETQYAQFLAEHPPLPDSDPRVKRVKEIGVKIQKNVETFLAEQNASDRVEGFGWEFNVVDEPVVNAWCMPGGKVVVYTEILKLATDDDMLAVIMGHEIAHAIARHGNERMSQQVGVNVVGAVLGAGSKTNNDVFLQSYGVASTLGILGYSRKHESEADKLGLVFMALAGYNPEKAITFWEKMAELGGEKPPELLSTHPSDDTRIQDIKDFLPEISKYTEK